MKVAAVFAIALVVSPVNGLAQTPAPRPGGETNYEAAVRGEKEHLAASCMSGVKSLFKCPIALATGKPFHFAFGNLAPGNSVGLGAAFVYHTTPTPEHDRSWSADAVISPNRSWRAGIYQKTVLTDIGLLTAVPISGAPPIGDVTLHPYPVLDFFVQGTSLEEVATFDRQTTGASRTIFAERQFIGGGRFVRPATIRSALKSTLTAKVSLRFSAVSDPVPEGAAQSNRNDSSFLELGLGYSVAPALAADRLRLKYSARVDQFISLSQAESHFTRVVGELNNEWTIYGVRQTIGESDGVGPNDCANAPGNHQCPPVSVSRNQYGSIHLNGFASFSGKHTPFYMQQTLGGADVNGRPGLLAFADYRFRGNSLALITGAFEHYVASVLGVSAIAEYGFIASPGETLSWANRHRSLGIGVSIRVGALPVAHVLFANGNEGHRVVLLIETTLLGGSKRPGIQ